MKIDANDKIVFGGFTNTGIFFARFESEGNWDSSFANNGYFVSSSLKQIFQLQVLENNKILGAGNIDEGSYTSFASIMLNSNGSLEAGYGTNGVSSTDFGFSSDATAALAKNNKVILLGFSKPGTLEKFTLAQYSNSGILDPSFGSNGKVIVDMDNGEYSFGFSLSALSNGNLVALARVQYSNSTQLAIMQFTPSGNLVPSFGNNGIAIANVDVAQDSRSLAIQKAGKIVVGGFHSTQPNYLNSKCLFLRYNVDGSLDSSFGNSGVVSLAEGVDCKVYQILLQEDGKILASGLVRPNATDVRAFLLRLNQNGSIDQEFAQNGKFIGEWSGELPIGMQFSKTGKLILGGYRFESGSTQEIFIYRFQ